MELGVFLDKMADILSSGCSDEFTDWHSTATKELFDEIEDRSTLLRYVNTFYENEEPSHLREGELDSIGELLEAEPVVSITFVRLSALIP